MIIEPRRNIRIWPLVQVGLRRCWAARDHLIRLGVLPLAAMVLILTPLQGTVLAVGESADASGGGANSDLMMRALWLGLCLSVVIVVFAVNWLRQLTLGATAVPGLGLALGVRHFRFFFLIAGLTIAVGILAMILALVLSPLGMAGRLTALMLGFIVWIVAIVRLSPGWIGIAIDAPMPISLAWRRTAGQGFKLVLAMLAVEVPVMFAQQVMAEIFETTGLIVAAPLTFSLLLAILELIRIAVQLAVLASAFPHFLRETV